VAAMVVLTHWHVAATIQCNDTSVSEPRATEEISRAGFAQEGLADCRKGQGIDTLTGQNG